MSTSGWTDPVNLKPMFFRYTLDSATEFLFGQSVDSQLDALSDDHHFKQKSRGWSSFPPCFDATMMVLGTRSRISDLWWLCSPPSFYHDCKKVHEFADHYVSLALQNAPLEKFSKSGKQKYVFLHELTRETQDSTLR